MLDSGSTNCLLPDYLSHTERRQVNPSIMNFRNETFLKGSEKIWKDASRSSGLRTCEKVLACQNLAWSRVNERHQSSTTSRSRRHLETRHSVIMLIPLKSHLWPINSINRPCRIEVPFIFDLLAILIIMIMPALILATRTKAMRMLHS